jgi:hypothetical protein
MMSPRNNIETGKWATSEGIGVLRTTQDKQAEQCLWKTTMYAVIEEFRRRIKIALAGGDDTKDNYLKV